MPRVHFMRILAHCCACRWNNVADVDRTATTGLRDLSNLLNAQGHRGGRRGSAHAGVWQLCRCHMLRWVDVLHEYRQVHPSLCTCPCSSHACINSTGFLYRMYAASARPELCSLACTLQGAVGVAQGAGTRWSSRGRRHESDQLDMCDAI